MVILPTNRLLNEFYDLLIPAFTDVIVGESRNPSKRELYIAGNRTIKLISAHEPKRIEASTLAWAYADEAGLLSHKVFVRANARCRDPRAGSRRLGWTGVPIYGWLKDEFDGRSDVHRSILRASTYGNEYLPEDYIDALEESCPARMRKCFLDGMFVPPGGSVYPEFDDRHLVNFELTNKHALDNIQVYLAVDFSPRTPACLWAAMLPAGYVERSISAAPLKRDALVIVDELNPVGAHSPVTIQHLAQQIRAKGLPYVNVIADPAGRAVQDTSGIDSVSMLQMELGTRIQHPPHSLREIRTGINHVRLALDPARGAPYMYFARKLSANRDPRGIVNSMRALSYPEPRDGKPLDDNPIKDGITDHQTDLVRYLTVSLIPNSRPKLRNTGRYL